MLHHLTPALHGVATCVKFSHSATSKDKHCHSGDNGCGGQYKIKIIVSAPNSIRPQIVSALFLWLKLIISVGTIRRNTVYDTSFYSKNMVCALLAYPFIMVHVCFYCGLSPFTAILLIHFLQPVHCVHAFLCLGGRSPRGIR